MRALLLSIAMTITVSSAMAAATTPEQTCPPLDQTSAGRAIQLSGDGSHFITADGKPFLWFGDTAWGLLARLDCQDIATYLDHRAGQTFNTIQVVLLLATGRELPEGVPMMKLSPASAGEASAKDRAKIPTFTPGSWQIDPAVLSRLDGLVGLAARHDMQVAIAVVQRGLLHRNPPVLSLETAHALGVDLGQRYAGRNVIWWVTHDTQPVWYPTRQHATQPSEADKARAVDLSPLINALGDGLKTGSSGQNLISMHPQIGNAASWFADQPWFGFATIQSGHRRDKPEGRDAGDWVAQSRRLWPDVPVVEAEFGYENIPDGLGKSGTRKDSDMVPADQRWQPADVAAEMTRALLSGAAGVGYGHFSVMEFWRPGLPIRWPPPVDWRVALDAPGAKASASIIATFRETPPWTLKRRPDLGQESRLMVADTLGGDRRLVLRTGQGSLPAAVTDGFTLVRTIHLADGQEEQGDSAPQGGVLAVLERQ
jgi:hypothetical protein